MDRDKPESDCHGKCQLKDKVKEAEKSKDKQPVPEREQVQHPLFLEYTNIRLSTLASQDKKLWMYNDATFKGFVKEIFHPPTV